MPSSGPLSSPWKRALRIPAAGCLALLLALTAGACGEPASAPDVPPRVGRLAQPPPIVLVTLDTLRYDHLGLYGHPRPTSPNLDRLAEEGLVFERAYATSATTLPSHLSMLTGLLPHQHGYTANHGDVAGDIGGPWRSTPGRRSAAELLRQEGWETAAFVSGPTVWKETGIGAGFDHFDQAAHGVRRADVTTDAVLSWLRERAAGADPESESPLFLWVHYWDPHEPNQPVASFRELFRAGPEVERLLEARSVDPAALETASTALEKAQFFAPELVSEGIQHRRAALPAIDAAALADLYDRYDADVRYLDHHLGRLFDGLRELGLWDRALLAVAGDHGQSLGEHDWLPHGRLHEEAIRVPLILRLPEALTAGEGRELPGLRVSQVVSLVDLMPTLLARIEGAPGAVLGKQAEGRDVLSGTFDRGWAFAQRTTRERPEWHQGLQFVLVTPRWRYVHRTEDPDELYDLEKDPGTLDNVLEDHPEIAAELWRELRRTLGRRPVQPLESGEEHSEALLEQLRSLGYVD